MITIEKRVNQGLIMIHRTIKIRFTTNKYGKAIPNNAANHTFSGLRYTESEAKPRAKTAIRLKSSSVYTKKCFK
jgi:hypothetical protein